METISFLQILLLAVIQGMAELLPVSSSAHVIVAEKLMGLDPSAPDLTFLLVMLHTGTMFSVIVFFRTKWQKLFLEKTDFLKKLFVATALTGMLGVTLKFVIEKILKASGLVPEVESLFKSLPLISAALFAVGILIVYSGRKKVDKNSENLTIKNAVIIGLVQGVCLPFRGFSRSGATISVSLLQGLSYGISEAFSFALAVLITPVAIASQVYRLVKHSAKNFGGDQQFLLLIAPGIIGMLISFFAGLLALYFLSSFIEKGRWSWFGYYCLGASTVVGLISLYY